MASKKILIDVQVSSGASPQQINAVKKALDGVANSQAKVTQATKKGRAQSGLNNAILLETGRLASDASYGFTAIANNLSQVVTLFSSFAETNGGVVASLKELGKSLWGIGGILIGVQLLISFGPKILDFFTGMDAAAKAAAKSTKDLAKSLDSLDANMVVAEEYLDLLDDTNLSEQERTNITKELIKLVPDLTEEDLKYGNNLDDVRQKIKLYAIAQASRIEIDKLVEDNSELLAKRRRIDTINQIEDEEEKAKAIREYAKENDFNQKLIAGSFGVQGKLIEKSNEELSVSFQKRSKTVIEESNKIIDKIDELTGTAFLGGKLDEEDIKKDNENTLIKIGNFNKEINSIRKLRDLRNKYVLRKIKLDNEDNISEAESIEKKREMALNELNDLEMLEGLKGQARYDINAYYNALIVKDEENKKEALRAINQEIILIYAGAIGSMGKLFKQGSDASKAAALIEIAIRTGVGYVQGLDIAQKSAQGTGPLAAFSFPVFYATQVAAVLGAAAQAKQILSSGGKSTPSSSIGVQGGQAPSSIEAPDFNVVGAGGVSQLATTLAGVTGQPLKAFVVSKEITSAQELERNITNTASVG